MADIRNDIKRNIHKFDIICLLRLLYSIGYEEDEIVFRGYDSICSQTSLISDIKFYDSPTPWVEIFFNLGLLSSQSPLPSYFRKNIDEKIDYYEEFSNFIGFFDHFLIKNYIYNIYPEINPHYFPSWDLTKKRYLNLLNLASCHSLHWIFQSIFPELDVEVKKIKMTKKLSTTAFTVGKSSLGMDSVMGKETKLPIYGRSVTLYSEEETTPKGIAWPKEVMYRFKNLIVPILSSYSISLDISLIIKSQRRWAKLNKETYIGYDRIKNGELRHRVVKIFRGSVSSV